MVFFFWTTVVFGVLWFVAGKRQEKQLYEKSFAMHNPMLEGDAISEIEHPYFEFIK